MASYSLAKLQEDIRNEVAANRIRTGPGSRLSEKGWTMAGQSERTGIVPKENEGFLNKIFDVISRPVMAISNPFVQGIQAYNKDIEAGEDPNMNFSGAGEVLNPLELIKNMYRGASGQDKSSFTDFTGELSNPLNPESRKPGHVQTMAEGGAGGRVGSAVLGLGLDIAMDPTTYFTLGITKAPDLAKATKAGLEAGKTAYNSKAVIKAATTSADDAMKAAILNKTAKTADEARDVWKTVKEAERRSAGIARTDEIIDTAKNTRATLDLKWMGRQVAIGNKEAKWEAPMKGLQYLGNTALDLPTVGPKLEQAVAGFNKAFRNASANVYGEEINAIRRVAESQSIAATEAGQQILRDQTAKFGLSAAQKRNVFHAVEDGSWVNFVDPQMREAAEYVVKFNKAMFDDEVTNYITSPLRELDNYMPHYFHKGEDTAEGVILHKKLRRQEVDDMIEANAKKGVRNPQISTYTGKQAKAEGLDIVEEFDDVLAIRLAEHQRRLAHKRMTEAIEDEFGIPINKNNKWLADQYGMKPIDYDPKHQRAYLRKHFHFDAEVADQIKRVEEMWYSVEKTEGFLKLFDSAQNFLKFVYTVPNPAHHIRNLAGDTYLNFLDGVVDPRVYERSGRILNHYLSKAPGKGTGPAIRVGKTTLSAEEVMRLYHKSGAKAGFYRMEFGTSKFSGVETMRRYSENREDFTRLAHFIDALQKEGKGVGRRGGKFTIKQQEAAAEIAGKRVRKFNIDYGDLTETERKVWKRVVPFYTWMRKNIPLQIEMMMMRPGRQAIVPKGLNALETITGMESGGPRVEGFSAMPAWMKQMSAVYLFGEGQGRNGVYWKPESLLPVFDIGKLTQGTESMTTNVIGNAMSNLSPFIRAPIERATGTSLYTGAPMEGPLPQYSARELLNPSYIQNIMKLAMGEDAPSWALRPGESDPNVQGPNIFAAGLHRLTERQMLGELNRQQDPMQAAIQEENQAITEEDLIRRFGSRDKIPPEWRDYFRIRG